MISVRNSSRVQVRVALTGCASCISVGGIGTRLIDPANGNSCRTTISFMCFVHAKIEHCWNSLDRICLLSIKYSLHYTILYCYCNQKLVELSVADIHIVSTLYHIITIIIMSKESASTSTSAASCRQVWDEMNELLSKQKLVRNYNRRINMANHDYTVETELFPIEALTVYSNYNLGKDIQPKDKEKYFSAHRGGSQGDYREGIQQKIDNVLDCLRRFPFSKRAVITIPNNSTPIHSSDDDAKCMREIHFYLDQGVLNATVWMRAQAAEIFPKNIHFVGSLMDTVANGLSVSDSNSSEGEGKTVAVGELFYLATTLVSVRED